MAQGSRGYIGYKKEIEWGVDPAGAFTGFFPFISETLTPKIEEVMSARQRGILDEPRSYQGERSFGGELLLEVHPVSIGHILRSALGPPANEVAASSVETTFCDCETVWEHDEGVITSLDSSDKKKGSYSSKIQVSLSVDDPDVLASREITYNFAAPATTHYKFWIKSSIILAAADLALVITEDTLGQELTDYDVVEIPEIAVANKWYEITINKDDVTDLEAAKSVAIKMLVDKDEFTLWVDDFRAVVVGAATTAKKHIFTPMEDAADEFNVAAGRTGDTPLWPYTLEIFRDQGAPFSILGAIVNTLNISFSNTDKIVKAACGIIAKNIEAGTPEGIALESTPPFVWENAKIGIGGTAVAARNNDLESFSFTWDNKCIAKYLLNNTAVPGKIVRESCREVPVSFVIDFVDRTEYAHFLTGTERQFQIILEGADDGTCEAGYPYKLQLDFPLVRYLAYPINIGGPGRLTCAVEGKAKYSAGHVLQVTLVNKENTADYAL